MTNHPYRIRIIDDDRPRTWGACPSYAEAREAVELLAKFGVEAVVVVPRVRFDMALERAINEAVKELQ